MAEGPHAIVVADEALRGVLREVVKPRADVLAIGGRIDRAYAVVDVIGKMPATEAAKRWLARVAAVDAVVRRWP